MRTHYLVELSFEMVRLRLTNINRSVRITTDFKQEIFMWNKEEIKGKGKQIKGAVKDKVGEMINDPEMEAEGEAERVAGKVQESVGKARRKTGEAVEKVGKAISGKR
jgi:uncharacterized protein YjbJ (UPF0337 family)